MPRCPLCPQWAVTHWWQPDWDLERYLCGHHSNEKAERMVADGWAMVEDMRVDDLHPELAPLSADPATH